MARIALISVDAMTPEQRAQHDRFPSNLSRTLLLANPRLAAALPNTANALRASGLNPMLREAIILRVAALCGSAYERMQHLGQARATGLGDAQITAIEVGAFAGLPHPLPIVLPLADALVATPRAADAVFTPAAEVLSSRDLVTVILLVGHYMTVARLLETLDIDLDDAPDDWVSEH